MKQQLDGRQRLNYDPQNTNLYINGSQDWWHDFGDNVLSPNALPKNTSNMTSMKVPNTHLGIKDCKLLAHGDLDRGRNANTEMITIGMLNSGILIIHYFCQMYSFHVFAFTLFHRSR